MSFEDFMGGGTGKDPYTSNRGAFDDYGQAMQKEHDRLNGYFNRGNQAGEASYNAYNRDINDPNYMQDKIAGGYQQSPYQKMLLDQVTKRLNYNSANSGMMGSGAANRALMQELNAQTGQFQNEYIQRGLGLYGQGLKGMDTLGGYGLEAAKTQADLAQEAAGGQMKGKMSENETGDRNRASNTQRGSNMWGTALGAAGGIVGGIYGGPIGAAAGSAAGRWAGGQVDGGGGGGGNGAY